MSAGAHYDQICSWCGGQDEHEEFCNGCEFCQSPICCICWDKDDTCYFPGEGYCPPCRKRLHDCPQCLAYLNGLMRDPVAPVCDTHWK